MFPSARTRCGKGYYPVCFLRVSSIITFESHLKLPFFRGAVEAVCKMKQCDSLYEPLLYAFSHILSYFIVMKIINVLSTATVKADMYAQ